MIKKDLEKVYFENESEYLEQLFELLRIESVSNDYSKKEECRHCADYLVDYMSSIGLNSYIIETEELPSVFAEYVGDESLPTVLFYGHYDVMPVDPIELWKTDPFEPVIKDGRIYARGVADDKGQFFSFLKAIEYLKNNNLLRNSVKVLLDGSEENASVGLTAKLDSLKELLQADILMVADTTLTPEDDPAIVMGLRGMASFTIKMYGASHDLHSGVHGGVAVNPAEEICKLISTFYNSDGSVAISGFYDNIKDASEKELMHAMDSNEVDRDKYKSIYNVYPDGGENGRGQAERIGFRPNLCVNGISSGYSGDGSKTIIPAEAMAKISIRLVPGQNPADVLRNATKHVMENANPVLRTVVEDGAAHGVGFHLSMDGELIETAKGILEDITGKSAKFLWEGASIPIISSLQEVTGAQPLLVGFSTEGDKIHAPNESFPVESFKNGFIYTGMLLARSQ
ncbi:MAG: M20/M25/M40 family metallo-hydrolase [Kiritimatiellae bacterium]|jgi:acetylornithine deacetylase/succinyl-diaminopimelate desuccinylase-like protein|nr:M20/M25/M40 family metallo-hydrolase [Kiritimatiellia bacterium]